MIAYRMTTRFTPSNRVEIRRRFDRILKKVSEQIEEAVHAAPPPPMPLRGSPWRVHKNPS